MPRPLPPVSRRRESNHHHHTDDGDDDDDPHGSKNMSILDRMLNKHERGGSFHDDDDEKEKESTLEDMYDDDLHDDNDEGEGEEAEDHEHSMEDDHHPHAPLSGQNNWLEKLPEIALHLNDDDNGSSPPPPVTHFQPAFHDDDDDDSVSQITSSITSHSYYNSMSAGSWSRKSKPIKPPIMEQSVGDPSLADTLDEIAHMLGGGGPSSQQKKQHDVVGGRTQRRPQLEKIYEAQQQQHPEESNHARPIASQRNKLASVYEPYMTPTSSSSATATPHSWIRYLNPLVLVPQLFLQIKQFTTPKDYYYLRKKNDGDNLFREKDYFGALMGTTRQPKKRSNIITKHLLRRYHMMVCFRFFLIFCVMTAFLLVVRLGMIQMPFFNVTQGGVADDTKAGHVLRNMMMMVPGDEPGGDGSGNERRRQRQGRSRYNSGGNSNGGHHRHGGMAHHTTDDKVVTTPKQQLKGGGGEVEAEGGTGAAAAEVVVIGGGGGGRGAGGGIKALRDTSGANIDTGVRKGGYQHEDHLGLELPSVFDNFADVNDMPVLHGVDIPFFWHVPRSMGGTVNDILGGCLGLTIASDAGSQGPAAKTNKLLVTRYPGHFSYVNVDTSTVEGIARARTLGLAASGLAGVVVSTLLHNAASLFTEDNQGRMFTIVRHPVERAVSLFHFVQDTQWRQRESYRKDLAELSIDEYFKSGLSENNWMTRVLINELTKGELTRDDVNLAKEVMRRKCLIGLLKEKGETFARFERYFGWQLKSEEDKDCHEKKLQWAWPLKHRHDEVEESSTMWDIVMAHNDYDMELYDYATVLFQEQASLFQ